jgi:predicted nucleic acid-binding protein
MKSSLIDTDILSEFLRDNPKVVLNVDKYLQEYSVIKFSIITYYEILNGLLYKDAKKQLARFEAFVKLNNVIPLSLPIATIAAKIQAELRKNGTEIGHTDTLIAGTALVNNLQLVTNNTAHFQRIKELEIANWK